MDTGRIASAIVALVTAIAAAFGVNSFPTKTSEAIAVVATLFAGWVGPGLIPWAARYTTVISAITTSVLGFVAFAVAQGWINASADAILVGVIVAAAGVFLPSVAHPSKVAPAAPVSAP